MLEIGSGKNIAGVRDGREVGYGEGNLGVVRLGLSGWREGVLWGCLGKLRLAWGEEIVRRVFSYTFKSLTCILPEQDTSSCILGLKVLGTTLH